jgi:hypothetical protein
MAVGNKNEGLTWLSSVRAVARDNITALKIFVILGVINGQLATAFM